VRLVLVCLPSCDFVSGNRRMRSSLASGKSATPPARCIHRPLRDTSSAGYRLLVSRASCGASRELSSRFSPAHVPHTCAVSPTFRCGAFFFVASALADLSSDRLTTCALNTTCKHGFYNGSMGAVTGCSRLLFSSGAPSNNALIRGICLSIGSPTPKKTTSFRPFL